MSNFFGAVPTSTFNCFPIYLSNITGDFANPNLVVNNVIYNMTGNGGVTAITNNNTSNVSYFHNTIALDNISTVTSTPSYGYNQIGSTNNILFYNNIISLTNVSATVKAAINLPNTSLTQFFSNHNNIYITKNISNGYFGVYGGVNKKTLQDWQNTTSPNLDSLSYSFDPLFSDTLIGDLTPQFYLLDNKGVNLNITTDITGKLRNPTTPDIGAYEFEPLLCPTPLITGYASVTPNSGNCLGQPISLNLAGYSPLGSISFQWQDSISGGNCQNLGALRYTPQYDTITNARNFYRCIISCAISGAVSISNTIQKDISGAMPAGVYTIDSAVGTNYSGLSGQNFSSFTEALIAMQCGIKGSVVFNVKKGTYNERILISTIPGATINKNITFQGFSNVATDVKIISNGATSLNNSIVKFDSANNIIFKNIYIENTNTTYGRVIEFAKGSSDVKLLNCTIKAPNAASNVTTLAAIFAIATKGKNILIKGNTITNGSYGIYFAGTSSTQLAPIGNVIDSNIISGTYASAIYTQFTNKLSITRNNISMSGNVGTGAAGIYANYCDTAFSVSKNIISINNTTNQVYGLFLQNCRSNKLLGFATINGNEVYANTGNIGSVSGIHTTINNGLNIFNNVVSINSSSTTAYGFVNTNNIDNINVINNSISLSQASTLSVAIQLTQLSTGNFRLTNNIISNAGGGRLIVSGNSVNYQSDYNLFYTSGSNFFTSGTSNYNNLNSWKNIIGQDKKSLVYQPTFISNSNLRPDPTNPNSWALNGRGIQIKGNNKDIEGNYRPDSLTAGVPDLGAFEFTPTVAPNDLTAIPANPAPNTTQTFYIGSDTVMKLKWNATAPSSIAVKRYSGVVAPNINNPKRLELDSMFFYVKVDVPAGSNYNCDVQLNYLSSWLGSFPSNYDEYQLGLGQPDAAGNWFTGFASRNNTSTKTISQNSVSYLDKLTGLFNKFTPLPINTDTSNVGKEFWTFYPMHNDDISTPTSSYVLYLASQDKPTNVKVSIPSINWEKNYLIQPNTVKVSDTIPHSVQHLTSGINNDAIHIESDEKIVAYSHCYSNASSGATMLIPTGTWGYEYNMLSYHVLQIANAFAYYTVIAKEDNTKISYNSIVPTSGLKQAGDTILNTGEWLQVFAASSASGTGDLTGSVVKSIPNSDGKCKSFAFFSGDMRTYNDLPCGTNGGDIAIQQNLPTLAWGKKYLTAPTSQSTGATIYNKNLFRISIKDANQIILVNGNQIYPASGSSVPSYLTSFQVASSFIPGTTTLPPYIQFVTDSALYISSNKIMMFAQFLSQDCSGGANGDPDMVYLTPIEQAVTATTFYRNTVQGITKNLVTLIGSSTDIPIITDGVVPTIWSASYPHPNYPGKTVYVKHWAIAAKSQVSVTSNEPFTGITYGLGSVESYGYNIGTSVKNLATSVKDITAIGGVQSVCAGKVFQISTAMPILPDSISWQLNSVASIHPNNNITLKKPYSPAPNISIKPNGDTSFIFTLPSNYVIDSVGNNIFKVMLWQQDIEGCDKSITSQQYIQSQPPFTNTITNNICSSGLPYIWKGTSYTAAGTYYKTVPNAGTCDSNLTLILNVITKPVIISLSYNNPVTIGSSIIFNIAATGANMVYSWSGPLGFTSLNQNPIITSSLAANAGTYYVSISNGLCTTKDSIVVVFNGSAFVINGKIVTANKKVVAGATVNLSGASIATTSVDALGTYSFNSIPSGNYKLKPQKNNDVKKNNGVSSIDVILVQNHILNKIKLNSPYKIIAADVNNNKSISNIDIIFMKRLILGIDTAFTGNRLWTFVDSSYVFPDTTNPFPYKDSISLTNLASNKTNQTFIGVKLGDVNYDWNPALARGNSNSNLELIISNSQEKNLEGLIKIPFLVKYFKDLTALQYTLHFDNIKYELVNLQGYKNLQGLDFNAQKANKTGNISFIWTNANGEATTLEDGTPIFELVLMSKLGRENGEWDNRKLDFGMSLTNDITEIEAWDNNNQPRNIILRKQETKNENLQLKNEYFSVSPNPSNGEIAINLLSKTNKNTPITLTNILGKVMLQQDFEVVKGNNKFYINLKQNGNLSSGMYFLKVDGITHRVVINP